MKIKAILFTAAVVAASAAPAISEDRLRECSQIANATDRLACYDALAGNNQSAPIEGTGQWFFAEKKDELNDARIVSIKLDADSPSTDRRPFLVIRCSAGAKTSTDLFIGWNTYVNSKSTSVTTRIGNATPSAEPWGISNDNTATFYPGDVPRYVDELATETKLVVQVTPYNENPVTAVFDTTGLKAAAGPLDDACGWTVKPLFPDKKS